MSQATPGAPTLSVVMPTRGRRHRLVEVLKPLFDDPAISEIVVVVDGSQDGSIELLRSMAELHVQLRPVMRDVSGGAQVAREDGLNRSACEVVLFLDDDVRAEPGLAARHLTHHLDRRPLIVVGYMPVELHHDRRPGEFASVLYAAEYEGRCRAYERDPSTILRSLWWGNVSMRRSDAVSVGMVSPGLEALYHEDQDFGLRCREAGFTAVFDRQLRAAHLHERDAAGFVRDARSQGRGRVLVHRRHEETMGPLHPSNFEVGLGPILRTIVRTGGRPKLAHLVCAALEDLVRIVGWSRLYGLETTTARLLRRVAQREGAEEMWRHVAEASRHGEEG